MTGWRRISRGRFGVFALVAVALMPRSALAWGDEGHEIIAVVAEAFLYPGERNKVAAVLTDDPDNVTAPGIARAATWADRYRDSDRSGNRQRNEQTWRWHFVNVELADPNLDRACFGHPSLPPGQLRRTARRGHASSIRSSNLPANSLTPAPIPKNGWSP
jgi:S1/P1 Nuclease